MHINRRFIGFEALIIALALLLTGAVNRLKADMGNCGGATTTLPFTDVGGSIFFCAIAEAYFSGLTSGTTASTYSPADPVNRGQMAAFITRAQGGALRRGSRRAALGQWWTSQSQWYPSLFGYHSQSTYALIQTDGRNVYIPNSSFIVRVNLTDGSLSYINGLTNGFGVLCYNGWIWATGRSSPGSLYRMRPVDANATLISGGLGDNPEQLAYDGARIWTANRGNNGAGSVSIYDGRVPTLQTVTGFLPLWGIVYDGTSIWVSQEGNNSPPFIAPRLLKLNENGEVVATVTGVGPGRPIFDGTNIWVPGHDSNTVAVVRASSATVLATLTGNGLNRPTEAAFDGERILVTNLLGGVSLWKATDLTPIGNFLPTASAGNVYPFSVCSDGAEFFILAMDSYPDAAGWWFLRY